MKKIILALTALAIVLASCSDGADTQFDFAALEALKASNPAVASGTDGTESPAATPAITETEAPIATPDVTTVTTIGGITIGADGTLTISSSKVVFIGDASETIDGVEYKVKKYAQLVIDDNPYFYTYCKLYYLNDKLRRFYSFDHGIGCEMDYKYDEFVEHECGGVKIYTYYEDGKLESHIKFGYDTTALINGYQYVKNEYEYYSNAALKLYKAYACTNTKDLNASASWALYSKQEYEYHSNGETKQIKLYSNTNTASPSEGTLYLSRKDTYAESGKTESSISYSPEGWETSKTLYSYYDNGNQKSYEKYSDGKPTEKTTNYESGERKTSESYYNGLLSNKATYYANGNSKTRESYSNGKLSTKETYLENGNTESYIRYATDGVTEASKTLCAYYDSGNPKKAESYNNGALTKIYTFYDEKTTTSTYVDGISLYGKPESLITYAADGVTETSKTLYYESGNPKKAESYSNGALTQIYTFYDEKITTYVYVNGISLYGKPKTSESYSNGKLSSKTTYNENGKTECVINYAADGVTETGKTLYTYYANGKQKSVITYAADGVTEASKTLFAYYDSGNVKKAESYNNGALTKIYTFYDGSGTGYMNVGGTYLNGKQKTQESYSDGKLSRKQTYLENGNTESVITYGADGVTEASKTLCFYYDSGNPKKVESYGSDGKLTQVCDCSDKKGTTYVSVGSYSLYGKPETLISYASDGVTETGKTLYSYYDNGNNKTQETYSNGKLSSKRTYLEDGKTESSITYAVDGVTESSKTLYTYYDNGGSKTEEYYSNGIKSSLTMYFENSPTRKLYAYFNSTTGKVSGFTYYYNSGYVKYYFTGFGGGEYYLYTYADNKTRDFSSVSSVYSTVEPLTQEQAEAKLAELLNE